MKAKPDRRKQQAFLRAYAELGVIGSAAATAGISRTCHSRWLRTDPTYRPRWKKARQASCDMLEAEVYRRAVVGVEEPVFHGGKEVGKVRKYSDKLLELAMRANRPDKYRERREVTHKGGTTLKIESKDAKLSRVQEALAAVRSSRVVEPLPLLALDPGVN